MKGSPEQRCKAIIVVDANRSTCFKSKIELHKGMGRTILSFRIAGAMEECKWKPFRALLSKKIGCVYQDYTTHAA